MIQTFLFDMGNVLVSFCHDRMCRQMGALCGLSGSEVKTRIIDSGLQWEFERGQVTPEEFHCRFEQAVDVTLDQNHLAIAASDIFTLNESIPPILARLKTGGHRLVLLSNTSVWHFDHIQERYDVLQLFDDFVLSYRAGAMKPDPTIFEAALKVIDCHPRDCFYTDDIPAYVEAGRQYGLDAEIFTDAARLIQQMSRRGIVMD